MPKQIALTLCLVFIFWLLRLERKENPDVSSALWVPTLWLLLVAGKPLAVWTGVGGASMEEGSGLDRNFIILLLVIGVIILGRRQFDWIRAVTEHRRLFILIGFMLISVVWSDMPFTSLKRWVREALAAVIMAFIVSTEQNPKYAVRSVLMRLIYVHIPLSLLLIKYYPYLGVEYHRWSGELMWIGVSTQKNGLASLGLFSIFLLTWKLVTRRWEKKAPAVRYQTYVEISLLTLSVWLFMGPDHTPTYSATSTMALGIGLCLFLALAWANKRKVRVAPGFMAIIVGAIVVYGTITPLAGKLMFYNPSSAFGRSDTLTGRTEIWARITPIAMRSPIVGHGFGGFWNDAMREEIRESHSHNGYLEVILEIGFLGLLLWGAYMLYLGRRAASVMAADADWGILFCCLLVMGLVHNIAEATMQSLSGTFQATLLFLLMSYAGPDRGRGSAIWADKTGLSLETSVPSATERAG